MRLFRNSCAMAFMVWAVNANAGEYVNDSVVVEPSAFRNGLTMVWLTRRAASPSQSSHFNLAIG
jgi:hypothetical protein